MKTAKKLTDNEVVSIKKEVESGISCKGIAKRYGIGLARVERIAGKTDNQRRAATSYVIENKEDEARKLLRKTREYWDKLQIGQEIEIITKIENENVVIIGPIRDKKIHFLSVSWRDRKNTISFSDVISGQVKIKCLV